MCFNHNVLIKQKYFKEGLRGPLEWSAFYRQENEKYNANQYILKILSPSESFL